MKYRSIKRKLTITKIARKFQVYFDAVTTEIPSKLIHRVISFEELFIPVSRINEPCIPEERRGEKKKKRRQEKKEKGIKSRGPESSRTRTRIGDSVPRVPRSRDLFATTYPRKRAFV